MIIFVSTRRSNLAFLGPLYSTKCSGYSKTSARQVKKLDPISMIRTNKIVKGRGIYNMMKIKNYNISGTLEARQQVIDFFKLSKTKRPSSIESTIALKLSSNRIMSAAFLAISDPEPKTIPISA